MKRPIARLVAAAAFASLALVAAGCSRTGVVQPDEVTTTGASSPFTAEAETLGLPVGAAEEAGFDPDQLDRLGAEFRMLVDAGKLAGVTTLLARHGQVIYFDTYGKADATAGAALAPDSIFRIASMTKPITGVAMMQLWEQGKWSMSDPVSKYIPEFADLKVKGPSGTFEAMKSPMTMAQLMSHTAGFGVSAVYEKENLSESDLKGMIDKLARLPLETQPGTAWDYGPSVNIQGYIVERLSGQSLDAYFQDHIFGPLKMADTGFWVVPEKASRLAAVHTYDDAGMIKTAETQRVVTSKPAFLAGSGGLMSTAADYWRFAQAMLNGGELDGVRILKPETVLEMRKNVLPEGATVDLYGPSQAGIGFGMDFAVVLDPSLAGTAQGKDTFYWGGAFGTWFWIDPANDLVFVGMIQNQDGSRPDKGTPQVRPLSIERAYSALTDASK